jgi:hypothetical protein
MNDLQISYAIVLFARKLFPLAGAAVACGFASAPHTRSAARSIMYQDFRSLRSLELVDDHAFCATTAWDKVYRVLLIGLYMLYKGQQRSTLCTLCISRKPTPVFCSLNSAIQR